MLKSIVATLGNNLVKRGIPRPHAFQKAWRVARQNRFFAKAVGVTIGSRQEALKRLAQYGVETWSGCTWYMRATIRWIQTPWS